jgi:hypothetical protein
LSKLAARAGQSPGRFEQALFAKLDAAEITPACFTLAEIENWPLVPNDRRQHAAGCSFCTRLLETMRGVDSPQYVAAFVAEAVAPLAVATPPVAAPAVTVAAVTAPAPAHFRLFRWLGLTVSVIGITAALVNSMFRFVSRKRAGSAASQTEKKPVPQPQHN